MSWQEGQGDWIGDRRDRLNRTLGSSILITAHLARYSGRGCPDYPARRSMKCGIIFRLVTHYLCGQRILVWIS